jgi:acetyltransferase-like isoleucine patch superfamily enzyme
MLSNPLAQKVLVSIRHFLLEIRRFYYVKFYEMDIGEDVRISLKANLDKRYSKGVHLADGAYVAFGATILCHDMSRNIKRDVFVGKNCFIGAHSILLPGVRVGDESVVAAGAVVTKDVPPNSIVAGNPAKIIRSGIKTIKWGRIVS